MKKIFALFLGLLIVPVLPASPAYADYSPVCNIIDGASVYGYDDIQDAYVYLGSISNQYNVYSLANEYSQFGSEYNSKSPFNKYGDYGSEYSQSSVNNSFASHPPIMIDSNYYVIGVISTNMQFRNRVDLGTAYTCAMNTYDVDDFEQEGQSFNARVVENILMGI